MPKKRKAAATVMDLGGVVSSKVSFIRTDARAACREAAPSQTVLKAALSSPFEPTWPRVPAAAVSELVAGISAECAAQRGASSCAHPGVVVGLRSVTRALRRGQLRALVATSELQPPLLLAQLAALAHTQDAHLAVIPTSAAALGQPFGLLRAAVIGLTAEHYAPDHPLVALALAIPRPEARWVARPPAPSTATAPFPKHAADADCGQKAPADPVPTVAAQSTGTGGRGRGLGAPRVGVYKGSRSSR